MKVALGTFQKYGGVLCILVGLSVLNKGIYIELKAQLAQLLIEHAYAKQNLGASEVKPWPWADTHVNAVLSINHQDIYVLHGANGRNLAFGPAFMAQSADIGSRGNSVIVGHRDTHFAVLQHVKLNERLSVTKNGVKLEYEVTDIQVVDEHDVSVLAPVDATALTLITCYPFDDIRPNPTQRYVVRAIKIS